MLSFPFAVTLLYPISMHISALQSINPCYVNGKQGRLSEVDPRLEKLGGYEGCVTGPCSCCEGGRVGEGAGGMLFASKIAIYIDHMYQST